MPSSRPPSPQEKFQAAENLLFIVTDGEDNASRETLEQAVRRLQEENGPTVYSIGLLGEEKQRRARRALQTISERTGGICYLPQNPGRSGRHQQDHRPRHSQSIHHGSRSPPPLKAPVDTAHPTLTPRPAATTNSPSAPAAATTQAGARRAVKIFGLDGRPHRAAEQIQHLERRRPSPERRHPGQPGSGDGSRARAHGVLAALEIPTLHSG